MMESVIGVRVIKFIHRGKKYYVAQLGIGGTVLSLPKNAIEDLLRRIENAESEGHEEYNFELGPEPIENAMAQLKAKRRSDYFA
jgi:hypothetical protein